MRIPKVITFSLLGGLLALASGCGSDESRTVPVAGKIMRGGQAWSPKTELGNISLPPGDPGATVIFFSKADPKAGMSGEFQATLNTDTGTFTVAGPFGKGIPPGEYDVIVYMGAVGDPSGKAAAGAKSGSSSPQPAGAKSSGPPSAGPPSSGPPGSGGSGAPSSSRHGREIGKKAVTVPDAGVQDLVVEIPAAKK